MFFTVAFEEGGGERLYVNLLRNLPREEFEPTLLAWRVHESPFVAGIPSDVRLYDLNRTRRFRQELPRLLAQTASLLRKLRPDVIFAISTEGNAPFFAAELLAGMHRPLVTTEQGSLKDWIHLIRDVQPCRARLTELGYRYLYLRRPSRVVCVTESVRRHLIDFYGGDAQRLVTIPNPLDLSRIRAMATEPSGHPWLEDGASPVIVSTGRFLVHKGYEVLGRAFVRLAQERDVRLLLVGDGPDRPLLEGILRDGAVLDRVAFVGYQSNPFRYVARGTLFALPSHVEGFGYVLVEAMALGVPVVSTAAAGPSDILDSNRYGVLVPIGSDEAMAKEMAVLLDDDERRDALAAAGRTRAESFDLGPVVSAYADIFRSSAAS